MSTPHRVTTDGQRWTQPTDGQL